MKDRGKISWFGHGVALGILLLIDLHQRLRRLVSRAFLRVIVTVLSALLLVMVFSNLYALRQITLSVESLIGDSMVGVESAVAMRTAARETQLDLLRLQLNPDRRLSGAAVAAFQQRFSGLLKEYQSGVVAVEENAIVHQIEEKTRSYVAALQNVVDTPGLHAEAVVKADADARELVAAVEQAYQFNRKRLHISADEASSSARQALRISNRLWWSFVIFAVVNVLIYFSYRWLALSEEKDA